MSHNDENYLRCPFCGSYLVKRDGRTPKGFQRLCCYRGCGKYWQSHYIRRKTNFDLKRIESAEVEEILNDITNLPFRAKIAIANMVVQYRKSVIEERI